MPEPRKPAAVSGPGRMSRRTDGGPRQKMRELPDAQYGEAKTFRELQQGAPLAQAQTPAAPSPQGPKRTPIPFNAPTARPDEPVTAGNPLGAGPGPEAMGLAGGGGDNLERFRSMIPILQIQANKPDASQALRNFLQYLKGSL